MGRLYDRELKCGCFISSDGGGGLIPCHYGYGCDKKGCNENNLCEDCVKQAKLCQKTWEEWKKTDDYKQHCEDIVELNR